MDIISGKIQSIKKIHLLVLLNCFLNCLYLYLINQRTFFDCEICELLHKRINELVPLGLYKLWLDLRNKDGSLLAAYLGYSYKIFKDMVLLSPKLSGRDEDDIYWMIYIFIFIKKRKLEQLREKNQFLKISKCTIMLNKYCIFNILI